MKILNNKSIKIIGDSLLNFLFIKQKLISLNPSDVAISEKNIFFLKNNKIFYKNIYNFKLKSFFKKIVMLSLKRGLKLKFFKYISSAFKFFFYLFLHNNLHMFSKYKNVYNIYYSFFNLTNLFFNVNFLLFWLSSIIEPMFTLKCLSVPKKYRKKLKKKFTFSIFFLKKEKRKNVFLRWMYLNTFVFNDQMFFKKFLKSLLDIFLKNKKSNLYLKKIIIYKKILKKLTSTK